MRRRRDDPNQTVINWASATAPAVTVQPAFPDPIKLVRQQPARLIERLPWDFSTTFPQPTEDAIDAGIVDESDLEPDNLRALHENYTRECLANLQQLDTVRDARRRGVDPATGKQPKSHAARERLRKFFAEESERLERAFHIQVVEYENAFGPVAAHVFARFIHARHAKIPIEIDPSAKVEHTAGFASGALRGASAFPPPFVDNEGSRSAADSDELRRLLHRTPAAKAGPRRHNHPGSSCLPVPRPLPEAIKARHFGPPDDGPPINPTPVEVRDISQQHADKIIALLEGRHEMERSYTAPQCGDRTRVGAEAAKLKDQVKAAINKYAASFGEKAAQQLERYCRREQSERAR